MATDDFSTHHKEYLGKQREKVKESLSEEHAERLTIFVHSKHDTGDMAASTARNYLRELRIVFERAEEKGEDPDNWTASDWDSNIEAIAAQRGIGNGTKRNTCYAARAYCRWSNDSVVDDTDNIDAPPVNHDAIKDEDVLSTKEVGKLINAASRERDKALLSVMYEAAMRRTALIQLDVRHYRTEGGWNRIYIPDREGVKTAAGNIIPITFSAGHLDRWLTAHPDGDNPDAPLFCSIRPQDKGERLSSHSVYTMLKRLSKRTDGIDEEKVHPHILRHTRATNMRTDSRYDKADIETVMDWVSETPMHQRYTHASNREEAMTLAKAQGQDVGDGEDEHIRCPRCGSENLPNSEYCANCTLRLDDTVKDWFDHYRDVAPDGDIIVEEYADVPTAVPPLADLNKQRLDHVTDILMKADALSSNHEDAEELADQWDMDTRSVGEGHKIWEDILSEIEDIYVEHYARHSGLYQLASQNNDEGDINPLGLTVDQLEEMAKERDLL